jgi:hypothetical protein
MVGGCVLLLHVEEVGPLAHQKMEFLKQYGEHSIKMVIIPFGGTTSQLG